MSNFDDLEPATDIDPNVWYHLTEENVDDYDGDFKSMLQTHQDGDFRVFPVANRKTYWQFQPIGKTPGRYALRCSETTTQKQFAVCYRESESVENRRTRACLRDSNGSKSQQWDISLWGKNETYRFLNVANGTKYHLDVIPGAAVFMSPNLGGYQKRQRWMMTSVSDVDDDAYSTVFSNPPPKSTGGSATTTTDSSGAAATESTSSSDSDSSSLSGGAIAGIVIGAVLGVLAIALLGFFLWRRNKRNNGHAAKSEEATGGHDAAAAGHNQFAAYKPPGGVAEGSPKEATSSPPPVYELPTEHRPAELPVEQRHELR
ncbi:transmembrane alpha-helix [Fusarium albosuccineum]|uniref:Transmembrane alpha-helix n=1 Tax=Fusarium albosuccineum TaxID=1237068 RepID=A0A8H4LNJ4_9HYPO|nr:transmembrane alpha-helix [Fusarium albosuccineum]